MIHAFVPDTRRQKAGRVINIASVACKVAAPANGVYTASKFAVESLIDALRLDLAPFAPPKCWSLSREAPRRMFMRATKAMPMGLQIAEADPTSLELANLPTIEAVT